VEGDGGGWRGAYTTETSIHKDFCEEEAYADILEAKLRESERRRKEVGDRLDPLIVELRKLDDDLYGDIEDT